MWGLFFDSESNSNIEEIERENTKRALYNLKSFFSRQIGERLTEAMLSSIIDKLEELEQAMETLGENRMKLQNGYFFELQNGVLQLTKDKTIEVEVAVDHMEAEEFAKWINSLGIKAYVGNTTRNRINGVDTCESEEYNNLINSLWDAYCKA